MKDIAAPSDSPITKIEQACRSVVALRESPLLVLYYPGGMGTMNVSDVADCYQAFRNSGVTPEAPLSNCDVLLHTYGGDPTAAYQLAELIRRLAQRVTFLVPKNAYSAGSLLCFSGNEVRMGHYAGLSPIDITFEWRTTEGGRERAELVSIDHFMDFAAQSQKQIAQGSAVGSDLMCKLVDEVGALRVGAFFRNRTITGAYAQELLDSYMLKGRPNGVGRRNRIIRELLFEAPSHEHHFGLRLCRKLGLEVTEMPTTEFDVTAKAVETLDAMAADGSICLEVTDEEKMPFVAFFPLATTTMEVHDEHGAK